MSDLGIPVPASAAAPDVIHDIGYRHYEGRRLGRGYAMRSLYVQTLRGSFGLGRSVKSKILPMTLLGVMCVPALIAVAVAVYVKLNRLPIEYPHYLVIMEFVTAVFVASQAPVAVSRDLRFQTMPLYFSRPLTSRDYVRAKFAALASAVFILTALPMLVFYLGAVFSKLGFVYNTEHFAYGLFAAVCYSLLYSAIALLIASATPRRGFGVAGIIAVLLISSAISGIVYGVLNFRGGFDPSSTSSAHWAGVIAPAQLVDSLTTWLFHLRVQGMAGVPGAVGGIVFAAELVLIVVACYALLVRRYRRL
ncbi:ABC transporter permease [Phaeacidiphilus oryzae]|uniref:ABC transporter permease n=1 Tax=Phaeacidiphilus oryzae TaxID=348818 RepID=UPI000691D6CE|nr:ABC transporter permease [Phaeacidiphilus oryzae]